MRMIPCNKTMPELAVNPLLYSPSPLPQTIIVDIIPSPHLSSTLHQPTTPLTYYKNGVVDNLFVYDIHIDIHQRYKDE